MTLMKAAIVIVTRNRPESLGRTLERLPKDYPVIVVDGSDKPMRRQALIVCERHGAQYIFDGGGGCAAARNRGLRAAEAELVIFTDDDCLPAPGWAPALVNSYGDPAIQCVTGRVKPYSDDEYARTFEKVAGQDLGPKRRLWTGINLWNLPAPFKVGHGSNFSVHRETALALGGFDERFGAGGPFMAGEEIELFYRLLKRKHRILYNPEALVYHDRRITSIHEH